MSAGGGREAALDCRHIRERKTRLGDLRVRERDAVDIYRLTRERRDLYGGAAEIAERFARRDIADLPEMPAEAEIAVRLFGERHGTHVHTAAADNEFGRIRAALRRAAVGKALPGEQNALVLLIERRGVVKFTGLALDRGFHIAEPRFRRGGLHERVHHMLRQRLLVHAQVFINAAHPSEANSSHTTAYRTRNRRQRRLERFAASCGAAMLSGVPDGTCVFFSSILNPPPAGR